MIKIRITGLPGEVELSLGKLKRYFYILKESKPCKDRNSKYVRVYMDAETEVEKPIAPQTESSYNTESGE